MRETTRPLRDTLSRLMRRRRLGENGLAARAGLPRMAVYRLLSGERVSATWAEVQALADALGVTTEDLRDR